MTVGSVENMRSRPRVLVVDDEPDLLEILRVALTSLRPYTVSVALSAASALERIAEASTAFDIFLLDIQMPDVGGLELLGRIRRMPLYTETPVIMLTAMSDRSYVEMAFREGANDYVTKPFDYEDLFERIDAAHALSRTRQAEA